MKNLLFVLFTLLLASCAAQPQAVSECVQGEPSGFAMGLWHGWIAPITFFLSLFSDIAVFDVNNNGGWYVFGFLCGIGAFTGTASSAKKN